MIAQKELLSSRHESLESAMERSPYVKMCKTFLDRWEDGEPFWKLVSRILLDEEFVKEVASDYKRRIVELNAERTKLRLPRLPTGFDLADQTRRSIQTVVNILYRHGIVDINALRGAAVYVGTTNSLVRRTSIDSRLHTTKAYRDYVRTHFPDIKYITGFPPPPYGPRRRYFVLEVSCTTVKEVAAGISDLFDTTDAFRIALNEHVAHEYGHALRAALDWQGAGTLGKARRFGYIKNDDLLVPVTERVHEEHFARGVAELVTWKFISQQFGKPGESVGLQETFAGSGAHEAEAAYALLTYARARGLGVREIMWLERGLLGTLKKLHEDKAHSFGVVERIAYLAPAYSEEQIAELVKR